MTTVKLWIEFESANDAFQEYPLTEVNRILQNVAERILHGNENGSLTDINGNCVGAFSYVEIEEDE